MEGGMEGGMEAVAEFPNVSICYRRCLTHSRGRRKRNVSGEIRVKRLFAPVVDVPQRDLGKSASVR